MTDNKDFYPQLLPVGLSDLLPSESETESAILHCLCEYFRLRGYRQVKPPLLEFDSARQTEDRRHGIAKRFRVMDPLSGEMMVLCSDMTDQVSRIAGERLMHWVRPLRLFYSGEVLRVRGSQLRPERQFHQVGAEIIGIGDNSADIHAIREIIVLASEGLSNVLRRASDSLVISFDLSLPRLVGDLLAEISDLRLRDDIASALQVRDSDYLRLQKVPHALFLADLASAIGNYGDAIAVLDEVAWPAIFRPHYDRLKLVAESVYAFNSDIRFTVDIVENRGFSYQSGLGFSIYGVGCAGVLGRGGEYFTERGEAACGFSLYMDSLLKVGLGFVESVAMVFASFGSDAGIVSDLRSRGHIVVESWHVFSGKSELMGEATRRGFSHILWDGELLLAGGTS